MPLYYLLSGRRIESVLGAEHRRGLNARSRDEHASALLLYAILPYKCHKCHIKLFVNWQLMCRVEAAASRRRRSWPATQRSAITHLSCSHAATNYFHQTDVCNEIDTGCNNFLVGAR